MGRRKRKLTGKFWPRVRRLIWAKAQELFQQDQAVELKAEFNGLTATRRELREAGYFYQAKIIVLRNLYYASKGLPSVEEREFEERYSQQCPSS
jgi:hypothetical protein